MLSDYIEKNLRENKNLQNFFENLIREKYNGRGPFVPELAIVLRYCLKEKETSRILNNIRNYENVLKLIKIDKEIMILEEIFRKCHQHYMVKEKIFDYV